MINININFTCLKFHIYNMGQLNPSWRTICALVNSMIGGTMLTLPILFRESGLGIGVLLLLISGWISYKTCSLYVIHMSDKEQNIEDTIRRLLGKKAENFFRLITGIYLVCLNVIYVQLIVDQLFNILYFIFDKADHLDWITEKNAKQIVFDKVSVQILSLIVFAPLLGVMFIKNLSFLVKLTSIGVISVITYWCFILYHFFPSVSDINLQNVPLFSWNFGNLAGVCAVAFTIHTVVNPLIKANLKQENNLRDLKISYVLGFFIYASIGVLGSLPIIDNTDKTCKVTILNCYLKNILTLVVEICYFFMLNTVFPCFINVGRTRLLTYFYGSIQDKHVTIFNIAFMVTACIFAFFMAFLRLDLLLNLVGAFFCFFFIYLIPIRFHWACLYSKKTSNFNSLLTEDEEQEHKDSILQQSSSETVQIGQIGRAKCAHKTDYEENVDKKIRYAVYGIIMAFGLAVGVYGIYDFFAQVIG